MLKKLFPNYRYVTLEYLDNRSFAENDTKSFLAEYNENLIFDEAQRVPKLFSYLQELADSSNKKH